MKKLFFHITLFAVLFLTACSKYVDDRSTSTTTGGGTTTPTTPVTPPGGGTSGGGSGTTTPTSATTPFIKFYNVVDYGAISIKFNSNTIGTISQYSPSAYIIGVNGSNTILLTLGTTTLLNISIDLVAGKYYSCFMYKVGNDWKINLVPDDLTAPATGYSNIRLLDFRTQAYFDYVNTRVYSLGNDEITYKGRNFLSHSTFDSYTKFDPLVTGTYNCIIYNDSVNLANKKGFALTSGKIYSVILMTPANLSAASALYNIIIDVEQHN